MRRNWWGEESWREQTMSQSNDQWSQAIALASALGVSIAVALCLVGASAVAVGLCSAAEGYVDNTLRETIDEPAIGSVVYCDLALYVEHSGIYVGNGDIVHLDGGGLIEQCDPRRFRERLKGKNPTRSIYSLCAGTSPIGHQEAADHARSLIGSRIDYRLLWRNCHKFTASCLLQSESPWYATSFKGLKYVAWNQLQAGTWRVWDLS